MWRMSAPTYVIKLPRFCRERIIIGDGRKLMVECFGSIDKVLHRYIVEHHPKVNVSYIPGLDLKLFFMLQLLA